MTAPKSQPFIEPVPAADRVGEVRERLNTLLPAGTSFSAATPDRNLPCTLVKHPHFFEPWSQLGTRFRTGVLPPHDRELITLRVAHRVGSPYEWAHHTRSAKLSGVTDAEISAVIAGPGDDAWDTTTAAKLQAVDDVYDDQRVSAETWRRIAEEYDEQQLIELLMLIGFYSMTGWMLNSIGIEVDGWLSEPHRTP
ncbi:carboxymuconolactone decarboxylase family protein [Actinomadura rugatobispora]|uniref:Carboxymuconolactone decarboxylase family protein n=1 Tax=Actinomadura rugatobispora TaxID=1994 RepID=A0ABW0ZWW8_9ACTN|nr:carboxymuconolactone decarboxylase family protein [Actinomadura rugatobispora]